MSLAAIEHNLTQVSAEMNGGSFPDASSHFAFGENWASFARVLDAAKISEAVHALSGLLQMESIAGLSFLDIGSGSGLYSLAALLLGAAKVLALDVDPDSVSTTRAVLSKHAPFGAGYEVRHDSILSPALAINEPFDIVYSWGVLHHTGEMRAAISRAAQFVKPGGVFAFALYRKTALCGLWRLEKRTYAKAPLWLQSMIRGSYIALFRLGFLVRGRSFERYVAEYPRLRGMDFYHDVHDWLGGWPYESASPTEVRQLMKTLGFTEVHSNVQQQLIGLFGSGCNEYVYRRNVNGEIRG